MARNHARLLASIWNDEDFLDLTAGAQRLYMLLLSQGNIGYAGVLPLTVKRWAKKARNTSTEQVEAWLSELAERLYVVVDEDTDELLVRSFMRGDEVYKQPNVMVSASRDALAVASRRIRVALAVEARKLAQIEGLKEGSRRAIEHMIGALPDPEDDPKPNPSPIPTANPSANPRGRGSVTEVSSDALPPPPSPTPAPTTRVASPASAQVVPMRRDIESLCQRLAVRLVENGCKPPTVTERWRDAARLLLDRDHRDPAEAARLIDWCQQDEFWRANVQSMPTFREQYDRLRLQSQRASPDTRTQTSRQLDAAEERARQAEAQQARKALP